MNRQALKVRACITRVLCGAHSIVRPAGPWLAVDAAGGDSGEGKRSVGPGNGGPGPGLAAALP